MRLRYLLILLLLLAVGCTPNPASEPTPAPTATETPTPSPTATATLRPIPTSAPDLLARTRASAPDELVGIRVVHAAPGAPLLTVRLEDVTIAANLDYGQATETTSLLAGEHTLQVTAGGGRSIEASTPLFDDRFTFQPGGQIILIFTGDGTALNLITLPETAEPLSRDQSRVRFVNATTIPTVTVRRGALDLAPSLSPGRVSIPLILPTGAIDLSVIGPDAPLEYAADLRSRADMTYIISGTAANPRIIALERAAPGQFSLRAVNGSISAGEFDVYADSLVVARQLAYARIADRFPLTAAAYTIRAFSAGADPTTADPLAQIQISPAADEEIALVLVGPADDLRILSYVDDRSPLAEGQMRLTLVNTLPDSPLLRPDISGPLATLSDVAYGQVNGPSDQPGGRYTLFWEQIGGEAGGQVIEAAEDVDFVGGFSYLYLITGRIGDPPVIFSEPLEVIPVAPQAEDASDALAADALTARVRLINALNFEADPVLVLDQAQVAASADYGSGSPLVPVDPNTYNAAIRSGNQTLALGELALNLVADYTIIAYGPQPDAVRILAIPDFELAGSATEATIRLINASFDADVQLTLAQSASAAGDGAPGRFAEVPQSETFRRSMTIGVSPVSRMAEVTGAGVSPALPIRAGLLDLHVVDARTGDIAASIRRADLAPGRHYDVIAFQRLDSPRIDAFVLAYPASSD